MTTPATQTSPRLTYSAALLTAVVGMSTALSPAWAERLDNAIDPSGSWKNAQGSLSLMLTGDALSFSYSSVFGPAAHICDGAGVAGLVGDGVYHHMDDQGAFAILVTEDEVRMEQVAGIVSFCGADWPGERFSRDGFAPVEDFRVIAPVSHFHVVMPTPPITRQAYLIEGDLVQVTPTHHEQASHYALARFIGTKATTVGLIERATLTAAREATGEATRQADPQAILQSDILFIRGEYQAIRDALPRLATETAEIVDFSTEGGEAKAFRDHDGQIRLIELELYFDTGMTREAFYFSEGSLIFVLRARHQYNAPFYIDQELSEELGTNAFDADKTTRSEDRFYFREDRMIRWLDNDRNAMTPESASFKDSEKELREKTDHLLSQFDRGP